MRLILAWRVTIIFILLHSKTVINSVAPFGKANRDLAHNYIILIDCDVSKQRHTEYINLLNGLESLGNLFGF